MRQNEWRINNYEYISWSWNIPVYDIPSGIKLLSLYKNIENSCYVNQLYMIDEIKDIFKSKYDLKMTDYITNLLVEQNELSSPFIGGWTPVTNNEELKTSIILNNICFYNADGEIKNEVVSSARKILLETVNIKSFKNWQTNSSLFDPSSQIFEYSPISISGNGIIFDSIIDFGSDLTIPSIANSKFDKKIIYLTVECNSNIWFPWLWTDNEELFDNRELSNCHTPRLNNLISDIDRLIVDFGGRYDGKDVCSDFYGRQTNETQILLDVDPSYLD
jgi:hypothetical protein